MINYKSENIQNFDETALFYRNQPPKSFVNKNDDYKGLKKKDSDNIVLLQYES